MVGKKINNQWYYLDSAGNYVKGWINVDGKQYYLKDEGTRAANTIIGDYIFGNEGVGYQGKNENGKFYFADGWYYNFSDKKVYYPNHTSLKVGDDGKVYADERRVAFDSQGVLQSNWFKINRLWYSLNLSGKALIGWQKIDEHWYYFNEFGTPHIGWLKLKDNWYYFDKYTGIMHTDTMYTGTPIIITGETYCFDPKTGAMQTGWVTYESGDKSYFYSDGRMARNTKIGEYTIDNYGHAYIENYTGWKKRYDDWTYYENGKMITGWKFINNNWYYFDLYGKMDTGLESPIGLHGGGWYYLDSSGVMKTGWQKYNGEWCYFGSSGNMHMGWQKIDSKWYYFGPSKNMPELWTVNDKGVWYKYNISGAMKTGWQKIDGAWYYFDSSGAMKTGWLDYAGQKYYLQSSGAMATNTTVDGYAINAAGVAINKQVKELDDAKTSAIEQLKALNLKDQLNAYTTRIANAKTTDEIVTIVNEAKATSTTNDAKDTAAKELADAKASALETLKSFTHIDTTTYVNRVTAATNVSSIQTIVEEAKAAEVKAATPVTPKPASSNSILASTEAKHAFIVEFTKLLNDFRRENGLNEIQSTTLLNRAADIRSEDEKEGLIMLNNTGEVPDDWDHFRPDGTGPESAVGQAALEGYELLADGTQAKVATHNWVNENIAINYQTKRDTPEKVAQKVFTQWKNSPGHRRNMLSPRAEVFGIGFWGDPVQAGMYIEFTFIGGEMCSGFTKDDIQLFQ